jgi:uncharacterized membrane protein YedE/YeeE
MSDKVVSPLLRFSARAYLVGGFALLALSFGSTVQAQTASTGAIDQLKTDTAKVAGIYDDIVPVAVGSTVFGIGAILVKRIAFS